MLNSNMNILISNLKIRKYTFHIVQFGKFYKIEGESKVSI